MDQDLLLRKLDWLAQSQDIPERVAKQVARLQSELTRPKRVAIMGPPKSGKLDLMALLAGNRIVNSELPLGTIHLIYGDVARTEMTLSNGHTAEIAGVPTAETFVNGVSAIETTIHAPLPALKKINLMRLAEANDVESQVKAMNWAAKQSDIVVWCTARFGKIESRMWAHMSDQTRDHAFALMTTLAGHGGSLRAASADLTSRVGEDFAFAIATDLKAALSAQVSTPVDKAAMAASGGSKLISTLLREINQGLENTRDQAEVLLAGYDTPPELQKVAASKSAQLASEAEVRIAEMTGKRPAAAVKEEAGVQAAIDDLAEDFGGKVEATTKSAHKRKSMDPSIFPIFELEPEREARKAPETATLTDTPDAIDEAEVPALTENTIVVCQDMIVRLAAVGTPDGGEYADARDMYDAGLETLSWIDESLADVANDDTPRLARVQQMTEEATDLIQLLRLEDDDSSAVDAITVLLQMKRTVHAVLAA